MYPHPTAPAAARPLAPAAPPCPAKALPAAGRQRLALGALAGTTPVARLARDNDVSRPFVYRQADRARRALDEAFAPEAADGQRVLFTVPVTRALLRQMVLGLVLVCHSSFRGACEFLEDVLDCPLSPGTVANVVRSAVAGARGHNDGQRLGGVRVGAHDEIYQARRPVLVGCCAESTYCYLLSQERHADGDTWAARLRGLKERGLAPEATVADAGGGLRAGQAEALPGVPCRGDVFHILYEFGKAVRHLERRAYEAIEGRLGVERQRATPGKRRDRLKYALAARLRHAREAEDRAVALYDDAALLLRWLREDILSVAGPDLATRQGLYDFVAAELRARLAGAPKGLRQVCTALVNQRDQLLAFAAELEQTLQAVARAWAVPAEVVRELAEVQALPAGAPGRWQREAALRRRLGARYHALSRVVAGVAGSVVRASSAAENLNSRLRGYFFLRRQLGPDYLSLLQFFLNHRRLRRSARAGRVGKTPAELLTGRPHPHWLEMLGYQRFQQD